MKRNSIVVLIVLAMLLALGSTLFAPSRRVVSLEMALQHVDDPEEAAAIVRELLKMNRDDANAVVAHYAEQSEYRAFDPNHGLFLLHDPSIAKTHVAFAGSFLRPADENAPPDPALERAISHVLPEITLQTLATGDPPIPFRGIHVLESNEEFVDFVLRPPPGVAWTTYRFNFEGSSLISKGTYGFSDDILEEWREKTGWPENWKAENDTDL